MTKFFLTVDFFFFVAVATLPHLFKVINFIKCKPFLITCQDLAPIYRRKLSLNFLFILKIQTQIGHPAH